jgi:PKD repeat protein
MKTFALNFGFIILFCILSFFSFAQSKVVNISELHFKNESLFIPDVNGKVLITEKYFQALSDSKLDITIEVFPNWPVTYNGNSTRGGICCNMDADEDLEVVYCIGQKVYAFNIDGSIVDGWPQQMTLPPNGAPAFGDVDGDGQDEVVVSVATAGTGSNGRIYVFEKDGSTTIGFPLSLLGGATKTPVLADINGDGALEIIVEERDYPDGYMGVYYGNGTSVPGFPALMDYIPGSAAAVGDINGDGIPEIIGESYYSVVAFDINGNMLDGFPYTLGSDRVFSYSSPVLADLDGDGNREIIVGDHSLSAGNGAVHVITHEGTAFPGWPKFTSNWIYGPPSIGDIDGDGSLDIAVGDQVLSGSPATKVYAWDVDGNMLDGWPSENVWSINNQIILADIDGDNQIELMWDDNTNDGKYLGYNHDGSPMEGWPLEVNSSTFFMNPVIADVNNDGVTDICGGGIDIGGTYDCSIYLWDADAEMHPELNVLSVLQYNNRHDGVYQNPAALTADFIASSTHFCEGGEVQFNDLSTGNPTSWEWTFEGGSPSTSSEQNPLVTYSSSGFYDVSLIATNLSGSDEIMKQDFIKVDYNPEIPIQPDGPTEVSTTFTYYNTESANAFEYSWELTPEGVGIITDGDTANQVKIYWSNDPDLIGELKAKAINSCGESDFSESLTIYVNYTSIIEPEHSSSPFILYPNPASEVLHIQLLDQQEQISIILYNNMGEEVLYQIFTQAGNSFKFNISDLIPGIYHLKLFNENNCWFQKIIIK